MRALLILLSLATNAVAQVVAQDHGVTLTNELKFTETKPDLTGAQRFMVSGWLNGSPVNEIVTIKSAVTTVTINGKAIEILRQRTFPIAPQEPTQFMRGMQNWAYDHIQIRRQQEAKEADRLGFDTINKMKQFEGQNRSKILQAKKNGSLDPVGDVIAENEAKNAYAATYEPQDKEVEIAHFKTYMELQGAFQKAQAPIYAQQASASEQDQLQFAAFCKGLEEMRARLVKSKPRVLRTGDPKEDEIQKYIYDNCMDYLSHNSVKTTPPFSRPDINEDQKMVDKIKKLMTLRLDK